MLKKVINKWQFTDSLRKVKSLHKKVLRQNLKIMKFCLYRINKIGIPTNETETETLKRLVSVYDETLKDLNKDIDRYSDYYKK